jgi:hypothetical protein
VTGVNTDATEEAGEALVPPSGRTVWWSWTAAAAGWVKVTVTGTSGFDPVASFFSGPGVTAVSRRAWNDDASGATGTAAGLIFPVGAGEVCHFQVAGYGGSEGEFLLRLESVAAPPVISSLSLAPVLVDVTDQQGAVEVTVAVAHPAGLASGWLSLFRPNGVFEGVAPVNAGSRIAGTAADGTYRVSLPVRTKVPPGEFPLRLEVNGSDGTFAVFGERTPFPAGIAATVPVVNTGVIDGDPPAILGLEVSPATADVTTSGTTAVIVVRVSDPVAGISDFACLLRLLSPTGVEFGDEGFLLGGHPLSFRNRIAGNNFDGTHRIEIPVPAGTPPGDYPLTLELEDQLGNRVAFGTGPGETPWPDGLPSRLRVVNTGTIDTEPPALTSVAIDPPSINVAEFESMTLTVGATDARSGVASAGLSGSGCGLQPVAGGPVVEVSLDLEPAGGTFGDLWPGRVRVHPVPGRDRPGRHPHELSAARAVPDLARRAPGHPAAPGVARLGPRRRPTPESRRAGARHRPDDPEPPGQPRSESGARTGLRPPGK